MNWQELVYAFLLWQIPLSLAAGGGLWAHSPRSSLVEALVRSDLVALCIGGATDFRTKPGNGAGAGRFLLQMRKEAR